MRFPLRSLIVSMALCSSLAASNAQAYDLRIDRGVFSDPRDVITPQAWFSEPVHGDLYLATRLGDGWYYVTHDGLTRQPRPLIGDADFTGAQDLVSFTAGDFEPGLYPFTLTVIPTGATPPAVPDGSIEGFETEELQLAIGLTAAASGDFDDDGWPDDDLSFDGYADPAPDSTAIDDPAVTTPSAGRLLASQCAQCHGSDGISVSGIDGLRGESAGEIIEELREYAVEEDGIMHFQALGYDAAEARLIGEWFASLDPAGDTDGYPGDEGGRGDWDDYDDSRDREDDDRDDDDDRWDRDDDDRDDDDDRWDRDDDDRDDDDRDD